MPETGTSDPTAVAPVETGPIADVPEHPRVVERRTLHSGRVWDVVAETFEYNGATITREVLVHPGAVAVLALDDEERVLLIRQYRHPVRAREWEIPAGLLDVDGEPPLEAAQRELAEEADLAAERWDVLADFLNSPGGSDETIRIYLARAVSAVPAFERTEEEADIEVRWVPLDEALDAVLARRVQAPSLVVGVLAAAASRARGWDTLAPGDEPWLRHPKAGGPPWVLQDDPS
ncbi:NUDIX hydrolase [Amnibacterium sp. CER49]|uniref:NUDIX hydrolase n=1 Tax=Amnibacterium sp. CER49 TaxID=3039161 RepID=UPI0024499576|nr:NUDIX hydrolase [Amnibacterium sp. CER49]MDH2444942.1 NUDIX hydrolase [Amnibacterium sp. CER49]